MVVGWHELGWHELGSRYECTGARTPERSAVPGARLLAGELADRKERISRVRLQPPSVLDWFAAPGGVELSLDHAAVRHASGGGISASCA